MPNAQEASGTGPLFALAQPKSPKSPDPRLSSGEEDILGLGLVEMDGLRSCTPQISRLALHAPSHSSQAARLQQPEKQGAK